MASGRRAIGGAGLGLGLTALSGGALNPLTLGGLGNLAKVGLPALSQFLGGRRQDKAQEEFAKSQRSANITNALLSAGGRSGNVQPSAEVPKAGILERLSGAAGTALNAADTLRSANLQRKELEDRIARGAIEDSEKAGRRAADAAQLGSPPTSGGASFPTTGDGNLLDGRGGWGTTNFETPGGKSFGPAGGQAAMDLLREREEAERIAAQVIPISDLVFRDEARSARGARAAPTEKFSPRLRYGKDTLVTTGGENALEAQKRAQAEALRTQPFPHFGGADGNALAPLSENKFENLLTSVQDRPRMDGADDLRRGPQGVIQSLAGAGPESPFERGSIEDQAYRARVREMEISQRGRDLETRKAESLIADREAADADRKAADEHRSKMFDLRQREVTFNEKIAGINREAQEAEKVLQRTLKEHQILAHKEDRESAVAIAKQVLESGDVRLIETANAEHRPKIIMHMRIMGTQLDEAGNPLYPGFDGLMADITKKDADGTLLADFNTLRESIMTYEALLDMVEGPMEMDEDGNMVRNKEKGIHSDFVGNIDGRVSAYNPEDRQRLAEFDSTLGFLSQRLGKILQGHMTDLDLVKVEDYIGNRRTPTYRSFRGKLDAVGKYLDIGEVAYFQTLDFGHYRLPPQAAKLAAEPRFSREPGDLDMNVGLQLIKVNEALYQHMNKDASLGAPATGLYR